LQLLRSSPSLTKPLKSKAFLVNCQSCIAAMLWRYGFSHDEAWQGDL